MKKIFLFLLLISFSFIQAQNSVISGYITDVETNEVLINANIYDINSKLGAFTNSYGFYSISLPRHTEVNLYISYVGYTTQVKNINLTQDESINFSLEPDNNMGEVVIVSKSEHTIEKRNDLGTVSIPIREIKTLPSIGGESDILKAYQLMPGVQAGNEGSSTIFVRGGSHDQNLILLDNVPLYYVNHLGGFVSVFNTDAINNVNLIKGGFPASYGGRLSSVVDVSMREGNSKKFQGSGMLGLIATKLSVEGPIKNVNTSYIVSYRRLLFDVLNRAVNVFSSKPINKGYYFYDFNAKINHRFSDNDRLFLSVYMGDDRFYIKSSRKEETIQKDAIQWGNRLFALRWNHLFSQKLFSNLTLSHTKYRLKVDNQLELQANNQIYDLNYKQGVEDTNLKMDFNYYMTPNYKMKFGLKSTLHTFNSGELDFKEENNHEIAMDTVISNKLVRTFEIATYVENKIKIGEKLKGNIGLHYSTYHVNKTIYHSLEPRVLVNWNFKPTYSLKASYTKMQQNVHLLTSGNVSLPIDLWVPATEDITPQKSEQFSLGFAKSIDDGKYELGIETYYKKSQDLVTYKEGASFYNISSEWENKIEKNGIGTSYGLELLAKKKAGKSTGWLAYTLAKTDRQFTNINQGNAYPYHYDRRHNINIVYQYKLNKSINFSATWVYNTGKAITLAEGRLDMPLSGHGAYEGGYFQVYNGKNGFRMRDFHKLDIGMNYTKEKTWGEQTWNFSVYNAYNRKNPHYYYFVENYHNDDKLELWQESLFPIIPSVSYSFKF